MTTRVDPLYINMFWNFGRTALSFFLQCHIGIKHVFTLRGTILTCVVVKILNLSIKYYLH